MATGLDRLIETHLRSIDIFESEIWLLGQKDELLAGTSQKLNDKIVLPPTLEGMWKEGPRYLIHADSIYVAHVNHDPNYKLVYKIPVQTLLDKQSALSRIIWLVTAVYFVICICVIMIFLRSFIQPLINLSNSMNVYRPGQAYDLIPYSKRQDEIGVLINSVHRMTERLNDLIKETYVMEIRQKENQLQLLYEQINPHLLYNTLESIYWKSRLHGDMETSEMIKELSNLMKISLSRGRGLIPFKDELMHAMAYVSLQQKRYDYNFSIHWEIEDSVLSLLIPKITLQPLIENAIIHGVRRMEEEGIIWVKAYHEDNNLIVKIEDNGFKPIDVEKLNHILMSEDEEHYEGYGIRNVYQRIRMHFGEPFGLNYSLRDDGGVSVLILLRALNKEESDHV